ncbi:MAG: PD40 domain-containing protein [Planctomycetes bacterium]|nr:PD40 domain-containing protein [Planctomycetota bacterium]
MPPLQLALSRIRIPLPCCAALVLALGAAQAQETFRVSGGLDPDGESSLGSLSADGRYVAFTSEATNLVPNDTNGVRDVFVRDRVAGTTERVSVDSAGNQGDGLSKAPHISSDGRFVAFKSEATNFAPGDANGERDVFIHDRLTGETELVSVAWGGGVANGRSEEVCLSADGRYVAFTCWADDLVPGDGNRSADVFVRDRRTKRTRRVSLGAGGAEADDSSGEPFLSVDGRFVSFRSRASNLVPGDSNGAWDVFVHDRHTGAVERVSRSTGGAQGDGDCRFSALSTDGRYVAFDSAATNLVPGDSNGAWDVFVHDRSSGTTVRVSVKTGGAQGNQGSYGGNSSFVSADGTLVAFASDATNLVSGDNNRERDVFVHDWRTGETERISVSGRKKQGNGGAWRWLPISANHRFVLFTSDSSDLVYGDHNGVADVFLRDRGAGAASTASTVVLAGPVFSPVGAPLEFSWCAAPPGSEVWLLSSLSNGGSLSSGHLFDVGPPTSVLYSGHSSLEGSGSHATGPVGAGLLGRVVYFELAARDGAGQFYDSNPVSTLIY